MELELVTFQNFKEAIDIQKRIFPNEDGTINILASLDRDLFMEKTNLYYVDDGVKYYIARMYHQPIGITGIYNYQSKDEVWLAWYGVLPELRGNGYGTMLLEKSIELVKEKNFKIFRLYADKEENAEAIKLYEKFGFVGEKYTAENLYYDCWIYSKSLTKEPVTAWNNQKLNLAYQSELDQMSSEKIKELLQIYEELQEEYNTFHRSE